MNKSTLLASTALVSVALAMGATSASALSLKLSGVFEAWVGYGNNDDVTGADVVNELDVKTDSEIHFKASEKLSNGWTVGATLEMEAGVGHDAAGGSDFDESSIFVKAPWGRLNIGNNDVASSYVGGIGVVGPVGVIKSDAGDWIPGTYELNNTDADLGMGDAGNVTYFTPRVGGLQLIVSYTPDASDGAASAFDNQETTGFHQGISAAVKYGTKIGGAKVGINGGYTTLERTDASGDDTSEGFSTSIKIKSGPVQFTAAYAYENVSDIDTFWGVGVIYKVSKAQRVSIGYGTGLEKQKGIGTGSNRSSVLTFGYEQNLGKGVLLAASVFRADVNPAGTASDFESWGAVGGFKLKF